MIRKLKGGNRGSELPAHFYNYINCLDCETQGAKAFRPRTVRLQTFRLVGPQIIQLWKSPSC